MKKMKFVTALLLSFSLLFNACETVQNTSSGVKGGVIGGVGGGAVGAGVGSIFGNAGVGAAIGAVVGGTAGALIGHKMDKQKKELEKIDGAQVETVNNGEAIKVTFASGILFATGSSTLSPASKDALTQFANTLKSNPETNLEIFGHTDITGSDKVNIPLSQERALAVQNFVVMQGVSSSRLSAVGKGSSQPVADNSTAAGKAANRRVEIFILANAQMINDAQSGALK